MLHVAILRLFLFFNAIQYPSFPSFNSTSNALSLVLTAPLFVFDWGFSSTDNIFPGIRRRGLGFSLYSEPQNDKYGSSPKRSLTRSSLWPRDLVTRPSANEAKTKALACIGTPTSISNVFSGEDILVEGPSTPYTPVKFFGMGPWTILFVGVDLRSLFKPSSADVRKFVYQILITLLPPIVIYYLNPSKRPSLSRHIIFWNLGLGKVMELYQSYVVNSANPKIHEAFMLTSERLLQQFAEEAIRGVSDNDGSVAVPAKNGSELSTDAARWVLSK